MTTRWIASLEEFTALAPIWDRAVEAANRAESGWGFDNPFLLADVIRAWSKAFVRPDQVRIWTAWEGDELRGGVALFLTRRRHGVSPNRGWGPSWPALHPVGLGFANLTEPFWRGDPMEFSVQFAASLHALPGWSYLMLPHLRAPLLTGARARWSGLRQMAPVTETGARMRLDPEQSPDAEAYLAGRNAEMRAKIRRLLRRSQEAGGACLHAETDPEQVAELIEFQLHHNGPYRYEPEHEVGASQDAWAGFLRSMLEILRQRGRLDAFALRIGGRLAAAGFGLRQGPGHKCLMASYDPAFRSLGPGFLYFYRLLEHCLQQGDPYLDLFADGTTPEKHRWCNEFPSQHSVWVFNRTPAGRALYWGGRLYLR